MQYLEQVGSPESVADLVSCALLSDPLQRQAILEAVDLPERLRKLIHFLLAQLGQRQKNADP